MVEFKKFTENDILQSDSWDGRISCNRADLIIKPLWFHNRGLMQTSTGYGRKLKTEYLLCLNNRFYRVFCCCYSNSGTCYIISKKRKIIVDLT